MAKIKENKTMIKVIEFTHNSGGMRGPKACKDRKSQQIKGILTLKAMASLLNTRI